MKLAQSSRELVISKRFRVSILISLSLHVIAAAAISSLDDWRAEENVVEVFLVPPKGVPAPALSPSRRPARPESSPQVKAAKAIQDENSDVSATLSEDPATESATSGPEGVADGRELDASSRYEYELRMLLDRQKVYPQVARKLRQEGRVLVRFKLKKDGTVVSAEIVERARHDVLNQAAHSLIEKINGLKPFPDEIKKTAWDFIVPIEYRL
jgi:periplasmic protein TonB